jgi:UDP:flavonoid glycosyltransferase YjiC (YdhE family)
VIIINGGFQSVCEAAVLGKPILSVPIPMQYESIFNAHQLAASGLGVTAPVLDAAAVEQLHALPPLPVPAFSDGANQVMASLGL